MRPFDDRRVLLVVAGGIAAYKAVYLCRELRRAGAPVDVILTSAGEQFVGGVTFEALTGRPVHRDVWERPLAHIALGREADIAVVAPATADMLARMAGGHADDMATATLLAAACPVLACPAMNVRMWEHPATRRNIDALRSFGLRVVEPRFGELAEGEVGWGRMAEPLEIMAEIGRVLEAPSLADRKVVVTAGPTPAPIDPVRLVTNRSSGRMGFALAAAAWRRGADVALIAGPTSLEAPYGPRLVRVERAEEMLASLRSELEAAAVLIMSAAVADFGVAAPSSQKLKRSGMKNLTLVLEPEKNLLAATQAQRKKRHVLTVGFALETNNLVENARHKLSYGIDILVANEVGSNTGFEAATNRVTLVTAEGEPETWPMLPKEEVAERLLDRIEHYLAG